MKKHILILIGACLALVFVSCKKEEPMSLKMVRSEIARCPDATYLDFCEGKYRWNYTPGLEMKSFLDVSDRYSDAEIFDYVEKWYDEMTDDITGIKQDRYWLENYNLDHVCPARTLFYLYEKTGKEKYRKAIELAKEQLRRQPTTADGCFWHKSVYPYQVWLDGLYMAQPFNAQYTALFEPAETKDECFRKIASDFINTAAHTYDPATKLYRHAWDETCSMPWADPQTGQSQHCWSRALGWYCMAIVDVFDWMPAETEGYSQILEIFRNICAVLPSFADPQSGMWYQVLDCPGREGNYLEATGSAMFTYAFLKGIRKGYLSKDLLPYAKGLYEGLVKQFITIDEQGLLNLNDCCSVGGLGGKKNRMGDYAYYLSEPIRSNDAKGIGPFIWASLEIEALN